MPVFGRHAVSAGASICTARSVGWCQYLDGTQCRLVPVFGWHAVSAGASIWMARSVCWCKYLDGTQCRLVPVFGWHAVSAGASICTASSVCWCQYLDGTQCRLVQVFGWHAVSAGASIWKFKSLRVGKILQLNFSSWKVPHFTEGCKATQFGGCVPASERNLKISCDSSTPKRSYTSET